MKINMKALAGVLAGAGMLLAAGSAWGDYTVNTNGTVTDNATGLVWQRQDDGSGRTWEEAIAYCEGLSLGGQTDWRLPNVKELGSIVDRSRFNPAIDPVAFPDTSVSSFWSSTTCAVDTYYAWSVDFDGGGVYDGGGKTNGNYYVRCVRGGQ